MKPLSCPFLASPSLMLLTLLLSISTLYADGPTPSGNTYVESTVYVGFGGSGSLQFNAGNTLTSSYAEIGVNLGDTGLVNIDGAGASWTVDSGAWIGQGGSGTANITGGGALTINTNTTLGYAAGSSGTVSVTGPGSTFNVNDNFELGGDGAAALNITQGGVVNTTSPNDATLAYNSDSTATIKLDGAGSQWNITNTLGTGAGSAVITVSNGGQINAGSLGLGQSHAATPTPVVTMSIMGVDPITGASAIVTVGTMLISTVLSSSSSAIPTISITNGGILNSGRSLIGTEGFASTYGTGAIVVDGVNANGAVSQWNVVGSLSVGTDSSTGLVTVSNGGMLSVYTSTTSQQTGIGDGTIELGDQSSSSSTSIPASTGTLYVGTGDAPGVLNVAGITGFVGSIGNGPSAVSTIVFNHDSSGYNFERADGAAIVISGSTQIQVLKGTTILSGADSYSGPTQINNGTLVVENNSALGASAVNVTGGTLQINRGYSVTNAITLSGGNLAQQVAANTQLSSLRTFNGAVSGGIPTTAKLLGGQTSAAGMVTGGFTHLSLALNDTNRLSDVFTLSGVPVSNESTGQTDIFVLQLQLNPALLTSNSYLGWLDPNTNLWTNAVNGNFGGTANFVDGAYDASTDFQLGDYGVDTTNGTVWAVLDHNSSFAVATVPEPSTWLLFGLGLAAVTLFRRRCKIF